MRREECVARDEVAAARGLWLGGRPLEAGRALAAIVPVEERAAWAGRVVAWAHRRSGVGPLVAVGLVIAAAGGQADGGAASAAITAALGREQRSGRFDSLREAVLTLAHNAALLLPGAAGGASDPRLAWWFVASLKCVGDELGAGFAAEAWPILARVDRSGQTAYLEATNPQTIPLYQRFGFRLVGTIDTGRCPPIFPMVRRIA